MIYSIIAAVAYNGVIGSKGRMPWKNKEEMTFFKEKTTNHPVIMGRTTWDSLNGKPLKNRFNIIVTRNKELLAQPPTPEVAFADSVETALDFTYGESTETFIIGGVQIWKYVLDQDLADRIYMNILNLEYDGDEHFPYYDKKDWNVEPSEKQYESFKSYVLIRKDSIT